MRKIWIIAIAAAVAGAFALIEISSSILYPVVKYEPKGLPPLQVGVERHYDFFKDGERVGQYVFWIEEEGSYGGRSAYSTRSLTSVVYRGTSIELESIYIFDEDLKPIEYRLNATLGADHQSIVALFDGWSVETSLKTEGNTVERELELPVNTVLIDTNMVGHWDIFLKSFEPAPGKRVAFNMYVPQILDATPMELMLDREERTLTLNGLSYKCHVIRIPDLNLLLYLSEGDLIQLEESEQNIVISLSS